MILWGPPGTGKTTLARLIARRADAQFIQLSAVMAGVKGGIAGGAAMIVPAILYGLIAYHSIWYPVNLLGGAGVAGWSHPSWPR